MIPVLGVLLILVMLAAGLQPRNASALGELTKRSLTLQADVVAGSAPYDGTPTDTVKHSFTFQLQTGTGNLGSIDFQYCTSPNPANPCTVPNGLHTTSAAVSSQSGVNTGFTLTNVANGEYYLTRTAATADNSNTSTYVISGVTNPDNTNCTAGADPASANNCTFFVRITTYTAASLGGTTVDQGSVAASTATPIVLNGYMPESLVFCTGGTVSTTAGVPDCTTATNGTVAFNQDFSPTSTAWATSQMAASTNAGTGYAITVNGTTLQSGSNSITAIGATAATVVPGTGQFGMDLTLNDGSAYAGPPAAPNITGSHDVTPVSNGTNLRGEAFGQYATAGSFAYNSGNTVADSGNTSLGPSDAQIYTVSYIVNVPGSQPAGNYTTTLTYICTPTF